MGWGNRVKQWMFTAVLAMTILAVVIQGMGWGGGFPA